jgi:arylsulfatase A-like enzyme/Flp pilus assembly protein TadD
VPPRSPAPKRRSGPWIALALALLAAGIGGAVWRAYTRRPNVLLVTIDTLRADHVGAYGYAGASTPVLDGLARRGALFESASSAVPLTGPSHATILTGTYPPQHGVRENVNFLLDPRHLTLATRLQRRGYRTAAFVAAYPVAAGFGFGQGFDAFSEGLHPNPGIGQGAERPANEVADAALAWLREAPTPFFAWVHFYDPHAPYVPPSPFRERFPERPYDGEIAFADAQLGRILEGLRLAGHADDTVIVVLADHGEGLGEHGEAGHGILLHEATLRVPFLLSGPRVPAGLVVKEPVGTVDVMPTLLALLGLEVPEDLPGRSLRPALDGRRLSTASLYAEALFGRLNCRWASLRALREEGWKLVLGAHPQLFHLPSDPGETRDRAAEEPERLRKMQAALQAAVTTLAPGGDRVRPVALSTEQSERLRSLGYTAGGGGAGTIDEPGLPDPRGLVAIYERLEILQSVTGPAIEPAIREIAGLLSLDPGSPFAHFVMAAVAYRGGHFDLAEKAFERTLALDPDRPVIRQHYGTLLRDMGRLGDSERELRIAAEQAPETDFATRINLAETLTAAGKGEEADAILRRVLEREPNHTKAKGTLGRVMLDRGRFREAIPYLESALDGKDPLPLLDLARAHLRLGEAAPAREAAGRALALSPGLPWALGLAGHALVLEGRRAEGLELLNRALAVGPRRAEVWRALGDAFAAAGEAKTAERCRQESDAVSGSGHRTGSGLVPARPIRVKPRRRPARRRSARPSGRSRGLPGSLR